MLTKGVLQSPTLEQLEGVLRHDAAANHDRIVTVFSEPAGWTFGCEEQLQASAEIQQCLSNHEAICYRAPDDGGRCCHEFPAMIRRLEASFTGTLHHSEANNSVAADGHNGDGVAGVGQPSTEVESSLRQKLKEQEELLAEQDQRIRELEEAADEKRSATLQRKKSKKKKHRAVSRAIIAGVWVAFFQRASNDRAGRDRATRATRGWSGSRAAGSTTAVGGCARRSTRAPPPPCRKPRPTRRRSCQARPRQLRSHRSSRRRRRARGRASCADQINVKFTSSNWRAQPRACCISS